MFLINMPITYGLARHIGPYSKPYYQEWARQNHITIDPWNQIVDTTIPKPSKYANPMASVVNLPKGHRYNRYNTNRGNQVTPGDVTALFGKTNNISVGEKGVQVDSATATATNPTEAQQQQSSEGQMPALISPTEASDPASATTGSFHTASSGGTPTDPFAQELLGTFPDALIYQNDPRLDENGYIRDSPRSSYHTASPGSSRNSLVTNVPRSYQGIDTQTSPTAVTGMGTQMSPTTTHGMGTQMSPIDHRTTGIDAMTSGTAYEEMTERLLGANEGLGDLLNRAMAELRNQTQISDQLASMIQHSVSRLLGVPIEDITEEMVDRLLTRRPEIVEQADSGNQTSQSPTNERIRQLTTLISSLVGGERRSATSPLEGPNRRRPRGQITLPRATDPIDIQFHGDTDANLVALPQDRPHNFGLAPQHRPHNFGLAPQHRPLSLSTSPQARPIPPPIDTRRYPRRSNRNQNPRHDTPSP